MPNRCKRAAVAAAAAPLVGLLCLAAAGCAAGARPPEPTTLTILTCHDSPGQQGPGSTPARLVNGVDGFIGDSNSNDLASVSVERIDGTRYLAWKTALAVAPTARPYRTVSVLSPPSARLDYLPGSDVLSRQVRMPVCGNRYTLFVGGIFVRQPACVDLAVTGRGAVAAEVKVPILSARCRSGR